MECGVLVINMQLRASREHAGGGVGGGGGAAQWCVLRILWLVVLCCVTRGVCSSGYGRKSCDRTRTVLTSNWGIISDGPDGSNYTQDSHCQWLIRANNSNQYVTLKFVTMSTECSYDYIFVYDGESFEDRLLGSFSGRVLPPPVTASSGAMLILLYSDTNYVLDGFKAEYSVTDCPMNCSGRGHCRRGGTCACSVAFGGVACERVICPNDCNSREKKGRCDRDLRRCICNQGYSGEDCSLGWKESTAPGNRWHWVSRGGSRGGLTPRAAMGGAYVSSTDRLYVFGGYDLNGILGDLVAYEFKDSVWVEIKDGIGHVVGGGVEVVGDEYTKGEDAGSGANLRRDITFSVNKNATVSVRLKAVSERNGNHIQNKRSATLADEPVTENYESTTSSTDNSGNMSDMPHPSPRFGHAMAAFEQGFYLYGGRQADGTLSNELWLLNGTTNIWELLDPPGKFRPPGLCRHTLTLVNGSHLYAFGGSLEHGEFSSRMFRIAVRPLESWEEVVARGGKVLDVRVVAHSMVYQKDTQSLILYGGIMADVARFSKLSDRMFLFNLKEHHWAEVHYPRAQMHDMHVPRERAFHTATIVGNYMVVFGGYCHRHNKEEICYDSQIYFYHLGCHTWVSHHVLESTLLESTYPKTQGVFAHAADLRGGNTLLIVGGYHGTVSGDLLAFTLPAELASIEGEIYDPETACGRYKSQLNCTANPECGWCPADGTCYERTSGSNCTSNLQTTQCPGICPLLGDCQSCLVHGRTASLSTPPSHLLPSVASKLKLGRCAWCVQSAKCHRRQDHPATCGVGAETPSGVVGWWGVRGTQVLDDARSCRELDFRPGLTFLEYKHPVNWTQPDAVSIVNATLVNFFLPSTFSGHREVAIGGEIIARLLGFIRPPSSWGGNREQMEVCSSFSFATLQVSAEGKMSGRKVVANQTLEGMECHWAKYPSGKDIFLQSGRYLVDFQLRKNITNSHNTLQKVSRMQLQHGNPGKGLKVFTFEYLEPYSNGSCWLYTNCLECLSDSLCGWCEPTSQCLPRLHHRVPGPTLNHTMDQWQCLNPNDGHTHFLTLQPSSCTNCSNLIHCDECVSGGLCEWWVEDAHCTRFGRSPVAVRDTRACPRPCPERTDCASCLGEAGRCVWCEATQQCFLFSTYTSEFQFGACREWVDQEQLVSLVGGVMGPARDASVGHCKECGRHPNCTECMLNLGCGWCYSLTNPTVGVCTLGNFSSPRDGSCSQVLQMHHNISSEEMAWSYAECPDVDECILSLHDCHENASCTNTHGSYICSCKRGFTGDGKDICDKTCYENCTHGYCSGSPDYQCKCKLGWMGVDCSHNCGCHNHSTCREGEGKCDECQDWTTGQFCERCRPGSYGNATNEQGCHVCNCNDHGDISRGVCDEVTGVCYCQDHTQGDKCDECQKGYYGNPRNGGQCYYRCFPRGILSSVTNGSLGSHLRKVDPRDPLIGQQPMQDCLWVLTVHNNIDSAAADPDGTNGVIQLNIDADMNVHCLHNYIYVYDGLPRFISSSSQQRGRSSDLLGALCTRKGQGVTQVESRSGTMTVYFKWEDSKQGFNATYSVLTCPDFCTGNRMCVKGKCICKEGWAGSGCDLAVCPRGCSADKNQGYCERQYGRCQCSRGFGGEDCSVLVSPSSVQFSEVFHPEKLHEGLDHLKMVLPRFGHSLNADHRGSVWLFGGYSLARGPLNDIREFDTKNNTWVQVTVQVHPGELEMPPERYFHAGEYVPTQKELYVYGGLGKDSIFLSDFWKFNINTRKWTRIQTSDESPLPLAGHTLTWRRGGGPQSLVLIGGFSPEYGFLDKTFEYDLEVGLWTVLNVSGNVPIGVYGHSTVYHEPTNTFYVFGGILYKINRTIVSNELYALNYNTRRWTVLPANKDYNPLDLNLPPRRFLHSAVTMDNYMVIMGGQSDSLNASEWIVAYKYSCNLWVRLLQEDLDIVGLRPPSTIAQAATQNFPNGPIYIMGGFDGAAVGQVTRLDLPSDLCQLWSQSKSWCKGTPGCSYCVVHQSGDRNVTFCSDGSAPIPFACESHSSHEYSKGVVCNTDWLSKRNCYQYSSCSECVAEWPSHPSSQPACQWCTNCHIGRCIPFRADCHQENICTLKQRVTLEAEHCPERLCPASDCDKCAEIGKCIWTRHVLRSSELSRKLHPKAVYAWNCVRKTIRDHSSFRVTSMPPDACPARCHEHLDCKACLESSGAEGGWHECRWSTTLKECISPSYQPLRCAGGVCGAVVQGSPDKCPQPCESFTQCSHCLQQPRCGWCSNDGGPLMGMGNCTEGTLEGPRIGSCDLMNFTYSHELTNEANFRTNSGKVPGLGPSLLPTSWHYAKCPPEDECRNGHHTCNNQSEKCVDRQEAFECICSEGYKLEGEKCSPVCSLGCVHGNCIEPDRCECHFGYVGVNCSIQCQCNGHANCHGPDALDKCLQCHNNTMGEQCEKCKPLFVGDPRNNGQCISCFEYCNGHTNLCFGEGAHFNTSLTAEGVEVLGLHLQEGPLSGASCIGCRNLTTGEKCEKCIVGNFRGSDDKREVCRPCECHGHGDTCDPMTGENCNCQNNTESDPQCQQGNSKNSNQQCWRLQCSKCKEYYLGTPTHGHQCYRQMMVDTDFCFDPKTQELCAMKPQPLYPGRTVFFAVQPKFMNVNIRIVIDVTQGGVDLYFSPKDDAFVVSVNQSTGLHEVEFDAKYGIQLGPEPPLFPPSALPSSSAPSSSPRSASLLRESDPTLQQPHSSQAPPNHSSASSSSSSSSMTSSNSTLSPPQLYHVLEREAEGLTTHISIEDPHAFLVVRNLQNRLVVSLPQDRHDLRSTRFYLALRGVGSVNSEVSFGTVFFRQDQLHIDLFVFFSVFFSCFFLFLAVCVVVWKVKQAVDLRRARRRHVVEMLHMAKRPFACVTCVIEQEVTLDSPPMPAPPPPAPPVAASSPLRRPKRRPNKHQQSSLGVNPQGGAASSLDIPSPKWHPEDSQQSQHCQALHNAGLQQHRFEVHPVAIEPTDDGVAAVATTFVQLPGGREAPVRLALASGLVLLSRVYPPASRAFLRRRASHLGT